MIFQEYEKFARRSGRKACRHRCIRPLGGPSQKQTAPACVLKPRALICSLYRVCAQYRCVSARVHISEVSVCAYML